MITIIKTYINNNRVSDFILLTQYKHHLLPVLPDWDYFRFLVSNFILLTRLDSNFILLPSPTIYNNNNNLQYKT